MALLGIQVDVVVDFWHLMDLQPGYTYVLPFFFSIRYGGMT